MFFFLQKSVTTESMPNDPACKSVGISTHLLHTYEPRHEISNNVVCATSKASDEPAHTCSLIRVFASHLTFLGVLSN